MTTTPGPRTTAGKKLDATLAYDFDPEAYETGEYYERYRAAILAIEAEARADVDGPEEGWLHPAGCTDLHDDDHNCLDASGSIIGWRDWQRADVDGLVARLREAVASFPPRLIVPLEPGETVEPRPDDFIVRSDILRLIDALQAGDKAEAPE